ncbi:MAG: aminoglycoside phosphotransferase family protein [Arachnia sp.]
MRPDTDPTDAGTGPLLLDALRSGAIAVPDPALRPDDARATLLGTGETYAAWLVTDGAASLVFRLARRRPADMPCPMADEFLAGPLIPEDIGSRPLAMDDSADNPLRTPYIVATFVPGSLRDPLAWDAPLLRAHARRLAALHRPAYALAGPIGREAGRLDIVAEFDGGYSWWRGAHPDIAERAEAAGLARLIRRRLVDAAPAFAAIDYSFIHGDLVATNIVVDDAGTPRYIDWEWARIGDVANDLALIGGRVTGGPWYVPMDDATVDGFLREYLAAREEQDPGAAEPLDQLRERRDAWELLERFLTSMHFELQSRHAPNAAMYAQATADLRQGLHAVVAT